MIKNRTKQGFDIKSLPIAISLALSPLAPLSVNAQNFELSSLNGANGFVFNGVDTSAGSGYSVSSAGDVNGDGIDDIIVGSTAAINPNGIQAGAAYVIFGSDTNFSTSIDVTDIDGTNGFSMHGTNTNDRFGHSVHLAGDINGDSIDDVIIGASLVDGGANNAGAYYVVFGRNNGFPATLEASAISGTTGFAINGIAADDRAGYAASAAGDINGDGIDDIIMGVRLANPNNNNSGAAYVVFGNDSVNGFPDSLSFSDLDGNNGFVLTSGETSSTRFGVAVSSAGDVNGDGLNDIIIGAGAAGPNSSGAGYIVFGSTDAFPNLLNLTSLSGNNGFALYGISANNRAGYSVSSAGDINGDGIDDIVVGAFGADSNGNYSGSSYVVFGSTAGFPSFINASSLNGVNGFTINGTAAEDRAGRSVSSAGDVNNDGMDDLIIGAIRANISGNNQTGSSYIIYGKATFSSVLNLSTLNSQSGITLIGVANGDESGISVSAAGDVNNDGIDDVIIGAWRADPNMVNSAGSSYVVFGIDSLFMDGFE